MQDDILFAGSIADNICFFDAMPDQEQIENVARMAQIHDDITAMPMGYHSLVGDMGSSLSGGQIQRVLLAGRSTVSRICLFWMKPQAIWMLNASAVLMQK